MKCFLQKRKKKELIDYQQSQIKSKEKMGDKLYSHDEVWRFQEKKTIKNYIGLNKKEKNYAVNFRRQKNN